MGNNKPPVLNNNLMVDNNIMAQNIELSNIDINPEEIKGINSQKRVISKNVEVTVRIVYTYEDGSTKEVIEKENHTYHY